MLDFEPSDDLYMSQLLVVVKRTASTVILSGHRLEVRVMVNTPVIRKLAMVP